MPNATTHRPLYQIADEIRADWKTQGRGVSPHALPYLIAMQSLESIDQKYYADDGKTMVLYFLNNAGSYRGEKAKALKAELRKMVGLK